jgi:alkylation response protein AidB-like acyl-CoA dehydrogenase
VLAALGRNNLTVARVVEPHVDALAILAEAGIPVEPDRSFGVFAAEAAGARLEATPTAVGGHELTGEKPWCSLGDQLDAALVTAHTETGRGLFCVRLRHPGVHAHPADGWVARGLRTVTSVPLTFDHVPAEAVGADGWYLQRPGFAWGGIGVAACWYGGACGLADSLQRKSSGRASELDALAVGTVDTARHAMATVLTDAARAVDAARADETLALRVRSVVAAGVDQVLRVVGRALGPAPLAFDAEHAARVADLELYARQHHGERDLARLGHAVLGSRPR